MTAKAEVRLDAQVANRLAHEVRSPLGVIVGALEQVAKDPNQAGHAAQLVTLARRSCARLDRLTRRLDRLGEVPAADDGGAPVALDVVVEQAVARVQRELRRAKVEVRLELPSESSPIAAPTALALEVALDEVVHNALVHARLEVTVHVQVDAERVTVLVRDDGDGFDQAVITAHPCHQTGSKRGLGLGLLTAHRWCDAVGGTVVPQTEETGGLVTINLPTRTVP